MKKSKLLSLKKTAKLKSSSEVASPSEGVKYRIEFIADQSFRGKFYNKGESVIVDEAIYNSYKDGRSTIVCTKLS